jgi:hypothetical protein
MRQLLNQLREAMYRAAKECVPLPSYPVTERVIQEELRIAGDIDVRLIQAAHILETIFAETRLAFDNTAWLIVERYRDVWNLLDGACWQIEEQAGLRGPRARDRAYSPAVAPADNDSPLDPRPSTSSPDAKQRFGVHPDAETCGVQTRKRRDTRTP